MYSQIFFEFPRADPYYSNCLKNLPLPFLQRKRDITTNFVIEEITSSVIPDSNANYNCINIAQWFGSYHFCNHITD